jgi:hypothetical protein
MPSITGYVGTIEAESRDTSRLWFSLTESPNDNDWVKIGANRAWFTMSMESANRPTHMAQLTLLLEAMRHRLHVRVNHSGAAPFDNDAPNDTFEVNGVRILRSDIHF